jgi:hypothetical protein
MPFTTETARQYGGRRPGAGRKTKSAQDLIRETLEKNAQPLIEHYIKRSRKSDKVLIHAIDKIAPDEQVQTPTIAITFSHYSLQLHAESVPSTVLDSHANGHQAGDQGMAPAERQGQDRLKFLDFKDVPTK